MSNNTLIPTHCPSCKQPVKVDGIHLVCTNKKCPDQVIQTILHWCEARKMDGIAESTIKSLVNAGKIKNIVDLYSLTTKHLAGLDGFGDSKVNNLLSELERTKEMTIGQFIDAIGIELVGEKAMIKMGITTEAQLWAFKDQTSVIGQNTIAYLKDNESMVRGLLSKVIITTPKVAPKGAKRIALTGSGPDTRSNLVKEIEAKGDAWDEHVGKDTNILLVDDINSTSSKVVKAKKMGIKILLYGDYFR